MQHLNKLITIAAACFLAFNMSATFAGKKLTPEQLAGTTRVSAEEVIELIESIPNLKVIDARKVSDFEKGHIEGAINLPNTETDEASLGKIVSAKADPVLFYCNGERCGRSVESAKKAVSYNYSKIYWFRGGMQEWEGKGLPVEK